MSNRRRPQMKAEYAANAAGVLPEDFRAALERTEVATDKVVAQARERLAMWDPATVVAWLTGELAGLNTPDALAALAAVALVRLAERRTT